MTEGSKTYYLPNTDIEVEVTYEIDGDEVIFQYAEIGGCELDCTVLGVTIDTTNPSDLVRTTKNISLKQWFQNKLDADEEKIFDYHEITVRSDRDEHYPAGLL